MILTLRTDQPEAELGLFEGEKEIAYTKWQAHRQLAETIHDQIKQLLARQGMELEDVAGIIVYHGPGSFTGLRIGISVVNALAQSLEVPIVGETGDKWIIQGVQRLQSGDNESIVLPGYGAAPHITAPKH